MDGITKKVGVLLGGFSAERDRSLRTAEPLVAALREAGYDASLLLVDRDVDLALRQAHIDVAFLALRGRYGGDGCLQGLLELLGIPYTGSGVLASGLAMNRAKTKEVFRLHNLPTAPGYVLRADAPDAIAEVHGSFGFPVVVRPVGTSAPLGMAVARDELELETALEDAFRLDDEALVERLIEGRRLCVGVLDGLAIGALDLAAPTSAPGSPRPRGGRLSPARYHSLLRLAASAYEAIGCEGAATVELVVSERHNEVLVDVDTNPSLVPSGTLARIAESAGLSYGELVQEILRGGGFCVHGYPTKRRSV
jgi:D-alanine-D-alanine ligase